MRHAGDRGASRRAAAWTASGWCCSRRRATRSSTSATSRRWPARPARPVRVRRRRQHDGHPARPAAARRSARDLTVGSDTKALTGHSDLLLGPREHDRRRRCTSRLQAWRNHTGSTPGPFEAWLGHRSMSTLDLRLARQAANAAAVAEVLAGSPAVPGSRWPWRAGRPVVRAGRPADAARRTAWSRPSWPTRPRWPRCLGAHPAVGGGDQLRRRAQHRRPAGPVGRRRRRRRGSCGSPAASRTPPTWSPTCQAAWPPSADRARAAGAPDRHPAAQPRSSRRRRPATPPPRTGSGAGTGSSRTAYVISQTTHERQGQLPEDHRCATGRGSAPARTPGSRR